MSVKMQRSIVFTEPQMKWLQKKSRELGITVSDVIRRMVDENREKESG